MGAPLISQGQAALAIAGFLAAPTDKATRWLGRQSWTPISGVMYFPDNCPLYAQPDRPCYFQFWDTHAKAQAGNGDSTRVALVIVIDGRAPGHLTERKAGSYAVTAVHGGFLDLWISLGFRLGNPDLGLPIDAEYRAEPTWADSQDFDNGSMHWLHTTPPHLWSFEKGHKDPWYKSNDPIKTLIPPDVTAAIVGALSVVAGAALTVLTAGIGAAGGVAIAAAGVGLSTTAHVVGGTLAASADEHNLTQAQQAQILKVGLAWRVAKQCALACPPAPDANPTQPNGSARYPSQVAADHVAFLQGITADPLKLAAFAGVAFEAAKVIR